MTAPDDLNATKLARLAKRLRASHSHIDNKDVIAAAQACDELASIKAGDSVVVPRVLSDDMVKVMDSCLRGHTYQKAWEALIAAASKETK